ncbi:MAG TPA: ATP-binding protein [Candidatus Saccharimonadales bacterium]|nr:ATP-binding protein [Candidatus Saccharimonadales bacterium]
MTSFSLLIAVTSLAAHFLPSLKGVQTNFGLTTTAFVLAALQAIYSLVIYQFLARRNRTHALLIASLLFWLIMLYGLESSSGHMGVYVYVVGWLISVVFCGIYGTTFLLSSGFATAAFVLVISKFQLKNISVAEFVLLFGSLLIAVVAWRFWRQLYKEHAAGQNNRLSGMLRTSQEQSEIIIQSIDDGVIVFDTKGKISLMNNAAVTLTEWSVDDALGVDVRLVMKLAQENGQALSTKEDIFSQVLTSKKHVANILQLNGHINKQVVSLVISPLTIPPQNDVVGAVAVFRDVTKARQVEQQRADFISTASHEMRTPVAAIEGYVALALNDRVSTIDSRARNYLEKAHESTEHLGQLFQDLLTSARLEDGQLISHPRVTEIGDFLKHLTGDLRLVSQKKQLPLELTIGSTKPTDGTEQANRVKLQPLYYVLIDPDRLREAISNLFDNAVKYTEKGKITVGLSGDNNDIQIYVKDTGVGIPADDISHLFQKFYRVDNAETRSIGGTGLGLFISRKIIELSHGRIWVESQLGNGSTFFINLPRLTANRAAQLKAEEVAPTQTITKPLVTTTTPARP